MKSSKGRSNQYPYERGMLYNPNDELSNKMLHAEFQADFGIDREKFLKYVVLAYDMLSPMRYAYVDLWERKRACAITVGFNVSSDGKFDSKIESMLVGENMECNQAIAKYIVLQGIPEYTGLIAMQTGLHFEMLKAQKGITNQNSTKNIILLQNSIKANTEYLFGGDEPISLRSRLYGMIEKERFPLPDDVIRRITQGDNLDDYNPYGDYTVDKLKYVGDE